MDEQRMDAASLHALVSSELATDAIQEIPATTYRLVADLIARMSREEYDGVAAKMKDSLLSIVTGMAVLLVELRMSKADSKDYAYLLDEEKRALDFSDEADSARSTVLSAILGGKSNLLETISGRHRNKMAVVVLRERVDALVGTDLKQYGPYAEYDIACLPLDNAIALESKNAAIRLRWADFMHDT